MLGPLLAGFLSVFAAIAQGGTPSHSCRSINHYSVIELPFIPKVIASSGEVAGITELHHAVLWRAQIRRRRVGRSRRVQVHRASGDHRGRRRADQRIRCQGPQARRIRLVNHTLTALPGNQTWARGVDTADMVVGEWVPEGKAATDAVYWKNSVPHSLGLCCGGTLRAVNDRGDMIGDAYDDHGHYHAFRWSLAGGQRSIDPADSYSSAIALNSAGHVLLQVGGAAYLDDGRNLRHLDLSAKFYNSAQALNDCDVVVGAYGPDSEHYRAFLWSGTQGYRDLNSFVPGDSGWELQSAAAINNRGEIVGSGELHGDDRGFVLIPKN